jgi:hypothetical protein
MLSDPNPTGPYKAEATTGEQIWRTYLDIMAALRTRP